MADLTVTATQCWHHASIICLLAKQTKKSGWTNQFFSVVLSFFSGFEQSKIAAVRGWGWRADMLKYWPQEQLILSLCYIGLVWCDKKHVALLTSLLWVNLQCNVFLFFPLRIKGRFRHNCRSKKMFEQTNTNDEEMSIV